MQHRRIYGETRRRRLSPVPWLGAAILLGTWLLGSSSLSDPLAQVFARLAYVATPAVLSEARLVGVTQAGTTRWRPEVVYRFRLGAVTYQSRRYAWVTPAFERRAEAEVVLAGLRDAAPVTAWYDPDDPERSVLDASLPPWRAWLDCAPWLLSGLLGLLLVLRGLGGGGTAR